MDELEFPPGRSVDVESVKQPHVSTSSPTTSTIKSKRVNWDIRGWWVLSQLVVYTNWFDFILVQSRGAALQGSNLQWIGIAWHSWDRAWDVRVGQKTDQVKALISVQGQKYNVSVLWQSCSGSRDQRAQLPPVSMRVAPSWLMVLAVVQLSAWLCRPYTRLAQQGDSLLHLCW